MSLRVGIDGFNLALAQGTGVATYGRGLSRAVRAMGGAVDIIWGQTVPHAVRPELRESLFFAALGEGRSGGESAEKITLKGAVRRIFLSSGPRQLVEVPIRDWVLRETLADRLPAFDRMFTLGQLFNLGARYFRRYGRFMPLTMTEPPPIMHWTYPLPLRLCGARNIYTLHDLVPLRLPYASREDRRYYDSLLQECIRTGDHILTVSEKSRQDILDFYKPAPEKLTNAYQAVEPPADIPEIDASKLGQEIRALFDLEPGGYFLFFGAIEPKKNVGRLIEAYLVAGPETPLVIVGQRAWMADNELRLLEGAHGAKLKGAERIRRIDYLPRGSLMRLVRGAKAVIFPSLYEGFGLPAIEAMTLGVPVLASTGGALPEVVADAALLANPYDPASIGAALNRLDSDAGLRARLAAAGRARAAHFSLAAFRNRLKPVYEGLLATDAQKGSG